MRGLVLAVLAALLMCSPPTLAGEPEIIAEADLLRVQLAQAQAELRARDAAEAKRVYEEAVAGLRARYHLGDADGIDQSTRVIKRAPKPDPKPTRQAVSSAIDPAAKPTAKK